MRAVLRLSLLTATFLAVGTLRADSISYTIKDIGAFTSYRTNNVGQSYSGTGFVGLYNFGGSGEFAHLFGIEDTAYSRTALNVDISGLAGATINSAYLNFVLKDGTSGTQNVTLTSFTADGSLEYFWNAPDNLGSSNYSVTGHSVNSLNVTSMLQNQVAAGADWFGLHLKGSNLYQWTYTYTGYGDTADEALVRLVVDYSPSEVPTPGSFVALIGMGGIGLVGLARRRRMAR